jgi:uncharacterized protein (DUF1800 family)
MAANLSEQRYERFCSAVEEQAGQSSASCCVQPSFRTVRNMANNPADSPQAQVAHVLRRLSFGPSPARVAEFAGAGKDAANAAIDWALNSSAQPINPAQVTKDDWDPFMRGWVDNLRSPDAALHEKMSWFWHGHFAVSSDKVGNQLILHRQQQLLREHALGNFRDMLRAVLHDAAMLLYLDASYSNVAAPNENLSRESMELFALGRGQYSEADVKAGALALAGFEVDYEPGTVRFNEEAALGGEVVFLGKRGRFRADDVVDILTAHEACAPFISRKIYRYLVGGEPSEERLAELAKVFRDANLQIRPLVEAIVWSPDFMGARMNRPRYAIEWYTAALHAMGPFREDVDQDIQPWTLEQLDQLPARPPNVAGWSPGVRWLSASQQLARAAYAWSMTWRIQPIETSGSSLVEATLDRCSLFHVSGATRATLEQAALASAGAADALSVSRRLMTTALCTPEFALA